MRIVVGVDDEAASRGAVDWVIGWPFEDGSTVTLVTSFDLLVSDIEQDAARLESEAARVREARPGLSVGTALADGSIPEVLRRWSDEADLLVIGSHRTTLRREAITGTLSQRLTTLASVPTIVVPEGRVVAEGDIVVGVADDDSSDAAVEFGARLASGLGLPLRLVHSWQRTPPASDPVSLYLSTPVDQREAHEERLRAVADAVRAAHPGLEVVERVAEGDAVSAFASPGRSTALLVVGTHRQGPIAAWILGSVGRRLLTAGEDAVCVVPPAAG